MHKFLARTCKSQDIAQSQTNFARSHDRETVTFGNSAKQLELRKEEQKLMENIAPNYKILSSFLSPSSLVQRLLISLDSCAERRWPAIHGLFSVSRAT